MTMSPNVVGELEGPRVYSWGGAVGAQKAERGRGKSYKGKERGGPGWTGRPWDGRDRLGEMERRD